MTRSEGRAVPLSPADVRAILAICATRGLLVGGQALAFWADRLGVEIPEALAPAVTSDADFIGDSRLARDLAERLGWTVWIPSLDDATPQTGKVTHREPDGGIKQVDFLSGVVGLTTKDVARRAVSVRVRGIGTLRVMHPVDVLDSRIQNLNVLEEKRGAAGVAQAHLAVDVVRAYVRAILTEEGERPALQLLERIAEIASDIAAVRVSLKHHIDPLRAVPIEAFRSAKLHATRWPQIQRQVEARRRALAQIAERSRETPPRKRRR